MSEFIQSALGAFVSANPDLCLGHQYRQVLAYPVEKRDRRGKFLSKAEQAASIEGGFWENVSHHCLTAAMVTDVLAQALQLPASDRIRLNLAAWFHDSEKKTERMWQRNLENSQMVSDTKQISSDDELLSPLLPSNEIETNQFAQLDQHQQKWNQVLLDVNLVGQTATPETTVETIQQAMLTSIAQLEEAENALDLGLDPQVTKLAHANVPSLNDYLQGHATLAEKIMWFADACLTGTAIVPIQQRFDNLENDTVNGLKNIAISDSFKQQYQGKSLYQVQRELGQKYLCEFSKLLRISEEDFFTWLQDRVSARIKLGMLPMVHEPSINSSEDRLTHFVLDNLDMLLASNTSFDLSTMSVLRDQKNYPLLLLHEDQQLFILSQENTGSPLTKISDFETWKNEALKRAVGPQLNKIRILPTYYQGRSVNLIVGDMV